MRTMNPANLYAKTPFSAMPPAYAQDPARLAALRMAAFLRQTPQTLYDVNNPQVLNRIRSEYGIDDRAWHQVATTIGGVSGTIYFGLHWS